MCCWPQHTPCTATLIGQRTMQIAGRRTIRCVPILGLFTQPISFNWTTRGLRADMALGNARKLACPSGYRSSLHPIVRRMHCGLPPRPRSRWDLAARATRRLPDFRIAFFTQWRGFWDDGRPWTGSTTRRPSPNSPRKSWQYEQRPRHERRARALDALFWDAPEVVRFGATENLYGGDEIRAFRSARQAVNLAREVRQLRVVTFGDDTGTVTLEFVRVTDGVVRHGRQSQTWRKFADGRWKVVSAHVSILPGEPLRSPRVSA